MSANCETEYLTGGQLDGDGGGRCSVDLVHRLVLLLSV